MQYDVNPNDDFPSHTPAELMACRNNNNYRFNQRLNTSQFARISLSQSNGNNNNNSRISIFKNMHHKKQSAITLYPYAGQAHDDELTQGGVMSSMGGDSTRKQQHPLMKSFKKYRIERLIRVFVAKLKQNAVLQEPVDIKKESNMKDSVLDRMFSDQEALQQQNLLVTLAHVLCILTFVEILIVYSMTLGFPELDEGLLVKGSQIVFCVVFMIKMLLNCFVKNSHEGKPLNYINQVAKAYLHEEFKYDALVLMTTVLDLFATLSPVVTASRALIFLKIPYCLEQVDKIKNMVCINNQREHQWGLATVLLTNFLFAHVISICLIVMARLDVNDNWQISHNLQHSSWYIKYVYGYYWATNIMLTVGFGDFAATTWRQALVLTFIQMASCITLAYNINCVGNIMGSLRAQDLEKNKNLKTFKRMYDESRCDSKDLEGRIKQYIQKSFEIKKKFNIENETQTLNILPEKLKEEFLKKGNQYVVQNVNFLKNMSRKSLEEVALRLQKHLSHPEEILIKKGQRPKLTVLSQGEIAYTAFRRKRGKCESIVIETVRVNRKMETYVPKLLCFRQFIKNTDQKYNVMSMSYSIIFSIGQQSFEEAVRQSKTDFEIYCFQKDQDRFDEAVQGVECDICKLKMHTKFDCPRLHYVPLREIVCLKMHKIKQRRRISSRRERFYDIVFPPREKSTFSIKKQSQIDLVGNSEQNFNIGSINESKYKGRRCSIIGQQMPIQLPGLIPTKGTAELDNTPLTNVVYPLIAQEAPISVEVDRMYHWKQYFPKHNVPYKSQFSK